MLGARLRRARRQADVTLERVAERAGCAASVLCDIERERVAPPPPGHKVLAAYAELFALSTRALDRAARRERMPMLMRVPWHKRARATR